MEFLNTLSKRLDKLLTIKSIVTLALTGVFAFLTVRGLVNGEQFMTVFATVIAFYFGTQSEKNRE